MKKKFYVYLITATCCLLNVVAYSDVVVIVHSSNTSELDQKAISKIYLGKSKRFPGGGEATPAGQPDESPVTQEFNAAVLKKKQSQLKAYWSKLVFTGKGTPPTVMEDDAEVLEYVKNTPSAIGYLSSDESATGVRIVGKFER